MIKWRGVVGYEDLYEVSSCGLIRSKDRVVVRSTGNKHTVRSKVLKPHPDNKGYLRTALSGKGKLRTVKVHREVAKAFINNPEEKKTVNHINGIKTDNRVSNLEWATNRENIDHSFKTGLQDNSREILIARNRSKRKLDRDKINYARVLISAGCVKASVAKFFGVHSKTLGQALSGETYVETA